jgi:hypothetical protein
MEQNNRNKNNFYKNKKTLITGIVLIIFPIIFISIKTDIKTNDLIAINIYLRKELNVKSTQIRGGHDYTCFIYPKSTNKTFILNDSEYRALKISQNSLPIYFYKDKLITVYIKKGDIKLYKTINAEEIEVFQIKVDNEYLLDLNKRNKRVKYDRYSTLIFLGIGLLCIFAYLTTDLNKVYILGILYIILIIVLEFTLLTLV